MKLQQMRYLCEIVACEFNISRASKTLHTSQPGISHQMHLLEQELGFEILVRRGHRITGLSVEGEVVFLAANRVMQEIYGLKQISSDISNPASGKLMVATTHIHARYTLLDVIKRFHSLYPDVYFNLRHCDPAQIAHLVSIGEVDLGISVEPPGKPKDVISIPCYPIHRILITPSNHPLLKQRKLTLESIARYPIIVYDSSYSSGWRVMRAFEARGLSPTVVLSAIDAEVIKAYVAAGVGVAIIQTLAYDPKRDQGVSARDVGNIFEPVTAVIMIRSDSYVRNFTYNFIELLAPSVDRTVINRALAKEIAPKIVHEDVSNA
jgi:LysR family cys regulon transcriptional activator